ncbi:hypothetical protein FANTH_9985 [Fusarium anthophilum]|uniref:Uncharacterized protein n=1 Tax=Fusarium anthophilum TaxID=48485 RepID=A0A8H4Z478_9HYPO|nr:hypothetical protein FANTH_9985 [Fusarium anthophilum]
MSSGVHFSSLPEPSEVGKIWQDLQNLIDDLKIELMEQEEEYAELATEFDSETKSGISDKEFQALRCRVSECWERLQTTRQDQFFYLKQQRRLAEGCLSRIAEQLGTLNVASMLSAIQASQTTKGYYENPIQPLFETIAESPHEYTSDSCE